jgi:hypothetical protein
MKTNNKNDLLDMITSVKKVPRSGYKTDESNIKDF